MHARVHVRAHTHTHTHANTHRRALTSDAAGCNMYPMAAALRFSSVSLFRFSFVQFRLDDKASLACLRSI